MKFPGNKIGRVVFFTLSGLILTGLVCFTVLYYSAQNYLNKNLSNLVEKKSKGNYEITFNDIVFSYQKWGIEINQVSYHPSDSILKTIQDKVVEKQFYSFSSPQIRIEGIKLLQLILKKKLIIGQLIVEQPELKIHGKQSKEDNKKDDLKALIQEIKPLVTKTFSSISIGKIELKNASYDFYNLMGDRKKISNAENISIGILDFYTDSVLLPNTERIFDASDIYLRAQKYQNRLADSIHSISAESITFSFKRSAFSAKNIEIKPISNKHPEKSRYYFYIPNARLTTHHIKEFYRNNIIPIDSLVLTNARIKYWQGEQANNDKVIGTDEFDLNDLIKKDIQGIKVQDFVLDNAQVQLFKSQSDSLYQQSLQNIRLKLNDFKLDSLAQNDTSRVFYSRKIDFSAASYEIMLGDNLHRVKVAQLNLSTTAKSVLVKGIEVFPQNNAIKLQSNTIEAKCDSIKLDNFDFKKAYFQKRFEFQRINLFNPEVKLTQNIQSAPEKVQADSSLMYKLISGYVKGVYASQVAVSKGNVQIMNKTGVLQTGNIESGLSLYLSGFALDENSVKRTDRLFYANQIDLNFSNYQMQLTDQLHKLTIENLLISTRKKQAKLQNLHLFPVSKDNIEDLLQRYNRSEIYEFTIPELSLTNADFHNAFFNKRFSVDSLQISTPQIYYENYEQLRQLKPKHDFDDLFHLISDYLIDIQINSVNIPEGTVRLVNHSKKDKTMSLDNKFSLSLGNLRINEASFNQKRFLLSDFVDFSVRDHMIRLSDNVHVLKAAEIGFSTRKKEIYATNARLYPETASKEFSSVRWNLQFSVPEIRIKGINIEEFIFDHKIDAENLAIKSPDIKLYQKQKPKQKTDLKEVVIPLPKEIESIALQNFTLNDGALKVFSEMGTKPVLLIQSDIKMAAKNILIQKTSPTSNPEFKKGDYTASLVQFKFTPKDKNQQFSVDELNFSTIEKQIQVKNLTVKPKTRNNKLNQYDLLVPTLSMNGFELENAYKNNIFNFESIVVDKPAFQRFVNWKDSIKVNPFKISFFPHFESFADVFYSKVLKINDANISIFQSGQKIFQENISLNLEKFRIDNKPSQGFLHSSDFSFTIPGIKKQGKLYHYEVDKVHYSSANNVISFNGIEILPNYSKDEHQKKVGFQSDYFAGKIDSILIFQPDLRLWFEKEQLIGRNAGIYKLDLNIFRDKRLPFDESRRPKMLQDLIKSIDIPVFIDSLNVLKTRITYSEKVASGEREGKICFSDIKACISPLSNMKNNAGQYPDFKINGAFTIQDSAQIHVQMNYHMNDPLNSFRVKGNSSSFNMCIFNPVIEPLALISIRSGKTNRFDFEFSANKNMANGQLYFGYDNLKIGVLEMKGGGTKESRFASFLANSLLLRNKNPRGKEFLPEEIAFKRDEKRADLNYWWKSVFNGVKNTLGIKDKQEEQSK